MASDDRITSALDELAGPARRVGWSVRGLSKWADNTRCPTAAAAFAARVNLDRLLEGTDHEVEFGQSPFMISRGKLVEKKVRDDGYKELVPILRESLGFAGDDLRTLNLKKGYRPDAAGLRERGVETRRVLSAILAGDSAAPNLIEGAVLEAQLGPFVARFEADAIGARLGPVLHGLEVKSWPVVDGRADDPGKVSEALRQLGFYVLLLRRLAEEAGADGSVVSPLGLLVTPKNVGLTLMGSVRPLEREIAIAETTLSRMPNAADYVGGLSVDEGFGPASAQGGLGHEERLEHLDGLTDKLGVRYQGSCLESCGMAKFCRAKAHDAGDPVVCGTTTVRFLPGVSSLRRAKQLADGAPPSGREEATGVAAVLADAGAMYQSRSSLLHSAIEDVA